MKSSEVRVQTGSRCWEQYWRCQSDPLFLPTSLCLSCILHQGALPLLHNLFLSLYLYLLICFFFFTNSTLQPANIICFGRVSFCANGMMSVTLMKNLEGLCSWLAPVNTPGAVLEKDSWLLIDIPRSSKTCWWLANPNRRYLIHCHTFLVSHTRWLTGNIFVWVLFYWKILHSIPLKP